MILGILLSASVTVSHLIKVLFDVVAVTILALQKAKTLFDRIEIWTVGSCEDKARFGSNCTPFYELGFVDLRVVQNEYGILIWRVCFKLRQGMEEEESN